MCGECRRRATCIRPCKRVEQLLAQVTRQASWREVPVSPAKLAYLHTGRRAITVASLQAARVDSPPLTMLRGVLTAAQFEVVVKKIQKNLSEAQIAKQLGISVVAVHWRWRYAKKKIRALCVGHLANHEG